MLNTFWKPRTNIKNPQVVCQLLRCYTGSGAAKLSQMLQQRWPSLNPIVYYLAAKRLLHIHVIGEKKWRSIFGNLNYTNYFRNIPCQCKPSFCKNDSCRYHFRHSFYSPWQRFWTHIGLPEHWQLCKRISWRRCMFIGGGGKAERDRKQRRQDSSKDYLLTQAASQVEENLK